MVCAEREGVGEGVSTPKVCYVEDTCKKVLYKFVRASLKRC